MLTVENVSKTFLPGTPNSRLALNNVSLHLEADDFVTVLGSNGAGKSTLFNAICGNFLTDTGQIVLDGIDITNLPEHKRAKLIGCLFQDPLKGTAPSMTIEENLSLAYLRGTRRGFGIGIKKRDIEFFKSILTPLGMGLENRLKTKIGTLSGGQRQAITLLMATIVTPKLLLLDEHTAALDPQTAKKVLSITNTIVKKDHICTMMITHNIKSALEIGNRTIMMDDGHIILDIKGRQREEMTVEKLLSLYSAESKKGFDNDRILLSTQKDRFS